MDIQHGTKTPSLSATLTAQKTVYGPTDYFKYDFKTRKIFYYLLGGPLKGLMHLLWDVKYYGRENVPLDEPLLIMPNHLSHLDSFLVGGGLWPKKIYHAIADEKLFKHPFWAFFLRQFNAFPIRKGAKQFHVLRYAMELVKRGKSLIYYPEGQRNKYPEKRILMPGKLGAGWIAHATRARVLPVFIDGAEIAMPIGKSIRIGPGGPRSIKLRVYYGEPLSFPEYYSKPESKEVSAAILKEIMDAIESLRPAYQIAERERLKLSS